jgi:hypothetical protein
MRICARCGTRRETAGGADAWQDRYRAADESILNPQTAGKIRRRKKHNDNSMLHPIPLIVERHFQDDGRGSGQSPGDKRPRLSCTAGRRFILEFMMLWYIVEAVSAVSLPNSGFAVISTLQVREGRA